MGLKDFLFNNDYSFLLQIAIILLSTKLLGLLTKRISLPQVVVHWQPASFSVRCCWTL